MSARLNRRAAALTAAIAASAAFAPATARPLRLHDLNRLQAFVQAYASPDGRRLIVETLAPYEDAGHFDDDNLLQVERTRLAWVDPRARRPLPHPLAPGGAVALGWSPSGRRLALARVVGRGLRLGIADPVSGRTRWTSTPVLAPSAGPSLVWRSETDLLLLAPLHDADPAFVDGLVGSEHLQALRRRQAQGGLGGPVRHVSGRFAAPAKPDVRLLQVDLRTGAFRSRARGAFDDLSLSPSGRFLALSAVDRPPALAGFARITVGDPRPRHTLTLIDLNQDRVVQPTPGLDPSPTLLDWALSGDRLLVFERARGATSWDGGCYFVVDAASGRASSLDLGAARPAVEAYGGSAYPVARGGWRADLPVVWGGDVGRLAG